MSNTRHHRGAKRRHMGTDFGAKYKCNKGYCAGVGPDPKALAHTEMRQDDKSEAVKGTDDWEDI